MRWQFQGGLAEDERRAFLFTNVVDSEGRRYDVPVAIGALAASARIYAVGMGRPVEEIGDAWMHAIANPIAPVEVTSAPCQEVIIKGDDLRRPDGGLKSLPVPISTPGYDAAPYLTATLCITQDPETGVRNMGTYRAALKATDRLGVRMAARPGGAGGYLHWQKYRKLKKPMPIAIVVGCAPVVMFTGPQKLPIDLRRDGGGGRTRRRADPHRQGRDRRSRRAGRRRDRDRGTDRSGTARARRSVRRKPRPCGARRLQHVDAGHRDHAQALAGLGRRSSSEVTPSESSVMKRVAYEPRYLAYLRDKLAIKGVRRVVMHEPLTNLRKVMFVQFAPGVPRTEIWRALHGAAGLQADIGKYVIAVSEDINPENPDAVFWSLAYRANPVEDVLIAPLSLRRPWPEVRARAARNSTMLIDATQKEPAPPISLPKREFMEHARTIWEELGLPTLKPQSPWHGYSLGDWDAVWDTYASAPSTANGKKPARKHSRAGAAA